MTWKSVSCFTLTVSLTNEHMSQCCAAFLCVGGTGNKLALSEINSDMVGRQVGDP